VNQPHEVKSASRTIDVLDLLAANGDGLTLIEIANRLGCPKSSAHGLLATLARRNVLKVTKTARGSVFSLGHHIFEIGQAYARTVDLIRDGQEVVRQLAASCRETVHLAALDWDHVVYLAKEEGQEPMRMVSAVGRRVPAYCTGVGKILLAGLDDSVIDELYPLGDSLPRLTPHTIEDPVRLRAELAKVRRNGHAVDHEESSVGLSCVAAPVNGSANLVAAMSVSVPTARFAGERQEELLTQLRAHARQLSTRLGSGADLEHIAAGSTRCL
jgi:IclR family transcriptional regulator, KDG regulon repressor